LVARAAPATVSVLTEGITADDGYYYLQAKAGEG
jgi:hypothetical protein